eukprot:6124919-Pleurochrysis_carterae.AAC.1
MNGGSPWRSSPFSRRSDNHLHAKGRGTEASSEQRSSAQSYNMQDPQNTANGDPPQGAFLEEWGLKQSESALRASAADVRDKKRP